MICNLEKKGQLPSLQVNSWVYFKAQEQVQDFKHNNNLNDTIKILKYSYIVCYFIIQEGVVQAKSCFGEFIWVKSIKPIRKRRDWWQEMYQETITWNKIKDTKKIVEEENCYT